MLLILVQTLSLAFAQSQYDRGTMVQLIDQLNKAATRGTTTGTCNIQSSIYNGTLTTGESDDCLELGRQTVKDANGVDFSVSVIPVEKLGELKSLYGRLNLLPNNYFVCGQRSHTIGHTLGNNGIATAKVYVKPDGNKLFFDEKTKSTGQGHLGGVDFHVGVLVLVRETDGQVKEYVIDPFLESKPVPKEYWLGRMKNVGSVQTMSRYNFRPEDRTLYEYSDAGLKCSYRSMTGDFNDCR